MYSVTIYLCIIKRTKMLLKFCRKLFSIYKCRKVSAIFFTFLILCVHNIDFGVILTFVLLQICNMVYIEKPTRCYILDYVRTRYKQFIFWHSHILHIYTLHVFLFIHKTIVLVAFRMINVKYINVVAHIYNIKLYLCI